MIPIEYLSAVMRTKSPDTTSKTLHLGLLGESGEVADLIKKATAHGHTLPEDKLVKELGDVLWYAAAKLDAVCGNTVAVVMLSKCHDISVRGELEDLAVTLCSAAADLGKAKYPFETLAPSEILLSVVGEFGRRLSVPVAVSEIMAMNVDKLRKRYPDGFSTEASLKKADEVQ